MKNVSLKLVYLFNELALDDRPRHVRKIDLNTVGSIDFYWLV